MQLSSKVTAVIERFFPHAVVCPAGATPCKLSSLEKWTFAAETSELDRRVSAHQSLGLRDGFYCKSVRGQSDMELEARRRRLPGDAAPNSGSDSQ